MRSIIPTIVIDIERGIVAHGASTMTSGAEGNDLCA
jgi:hypothetical protein